MAKRMMMVLALGAAAALAAWALWGGFVAAGVLAVALVLGGMLIVLRRNQRDLHDLEAGRVPPEVNRALGDAPPPE